MRTVAPERHSGAEHQRRVRRDGASAASPTERVRPLALLLLVPLAYLAALQLARAIAVVLPPWEQMYGESIIYDQAQRLLRDEPLYLPYDRPPYSVAAYTPVYYWLGAMLQALVEPGFLPGRLVSFASGLAASGLIGYVAWRRTGDRWAWPFAAALFLALGMPGVYPMSALPAPYPTWLGMSYPNQPWMALYKEDVLAVALSIGSVALLASRRDRAAVVLAGLLAALAFLTKQTTIAPAVAGVVWLGLQDRRAAIAFALWSALPVAAIAGVLELTTGAFLANTVSANANPFSLAALLLNLKMLGIFQLGPLLLVVLWLAAPRTGRTRLDVLLVLYVFATALPLVGLAKVGSNHNHWTEFAAATSVLATVTLWAVAATRWRALASVLALAVPLAAIVPLADTSTLQRVWEQGSLSAISPSEQRSVELQRLIERVRAEPRDVLANPLDVIVLAGRPILLEPYLFSIFESQGLWNSDSIVERVCTGRVGLIISDYSLELYNAVYHEYSHWPPPVYRAVREVFVQESITANRFVYVPKHEPPDHIPADNICVAHRRADRD